MNTNVYITLHFIRKTNHKQSFNFPYTMKFKKRMCLICGMDDVEAIHLFCLPSKPERLLLWEKSLGVYLRPFNKEKKVCNFHFSVDSFVPGLTNIKLKPDAVPNPWCDPPSVLKSRYDAVIKEQQKTPAIENKTDDSLNGRICTTTNDHLEETAQPKPVQSKISVVKDSTCTVTSNQLGTPVQLTQVINKNKRVVQEYTFSLTTEPVIQPNQINITNNYLVNDGNSYVSSDPSQILVQYNDNLSDVMHNGSNTVWLPENDQGDEFHNEVIITTEKKPKKVPRPRRKYKMKKNLEKVDGNEVFEITKIDKYDYKQSLLPDIDEQYIHFNNICLSCMSSENELTNIKDISFGELTGQDVLQQYVSISVDDNDELPKNLCSTCIYDLCRVYSFINTCKESYTQLKDIILKINEDEIFHINQPEAESTEQPEKLMEDVLKPESREELEKIIKLGPLKVDEPGPPFICESCPARFDTLEEIKAHRVERKHLRIKQYICRLCGPSKLFYRQHWTKHMRKHAGVTQYECPVCNRKFHTELNKNKHMLIHSGLKPHKCDVCERAFSHPTNLKLHRLKKHSDRPRLPTTCNQCGKTFATRSSLGQHMIHHGPKKYLCTECGQAFHHQFNLTMHMVKHTGNYPFKCEICGKPFFNRKAYDAHLEGHEARLQGLEIIRPYACEHCGKAYTLSSNLARHKLTHAVEKPYSCQHCNQTFGAKGHLTRHMVTHTETQPYCCDICNRRKLSRMVRNFVKMYPKKM